MGGRVTGWDNIGAALRAFDGPEWRIKHTTDHGRRADIVVTVVGLQYAADLPKPGQNVSLLCRQALYRLGERQKTFG